MFNDTITSNPKITANAINQFFCDIPKKIENEVVPTAKKPWLSSDYLQVTVLFLIQPTTEVEVEKYAETLKNHKANGPWSLPNKLFKQFKKSLKVPLAKLANLTIELGEFPEILKLPRLYWSIKKSKKADCSNYRWISLICNLSKILDKIMYDRL